VKAVAHLGFLPRGSKNIFIKLFKFKDYYFKVVIKRALTVVIDFRNTYA